MNKVVVLMFILGAVACASKDKAQNANTAVPAEKKISGPIAVQTVIPFAPGAANDNIKTECPEVNSKLSEFTQEHGKTLGVQFTPEAKVDMKAKGGVLVMEITNMHSSGNAFVGHNKSTTVKMQLYKDGKLVDAAERTRSSGGGMMGAYKGSCSVLGRTVKTLGEDVAAWVKTYQM